MCVCVFLRNSSKGNPLSFLSDWFMQCTGGDDVIVACAWDGTTYIIDHKKNLARHHFHEDVCAFALGEMVHVFCNEFESHL